MCTVSLIYATFKFRFSRKLYFATSQWYSTMWYIRQTILFDGGILEPSWLNTTMLKKSMYMISTCTHGKDLLMDGCTTIWLALGEALTLEVVRGCAALKTPFFKPDFKSIDPPFQAFFPLRTPHLVFWKNLAFQDQFLHIFSSWDTNFSKNLFRRPQFQAKKSVLETLFLKARAEHTYPKFLWLPPSPGLVGWWYSITILV